MTPVEQALIECLVEAAASNDPGAVKMAVGRIREHCRLRGDNVFANRLSAVMEKAALSSPVGCGWLSEGGE